MSISTSKNRSSQYPSRWVISSGGADVIDGPPGENSPFAKVLIEILNENKEDLSVVKLADTLIGKVSSISRQLPRGEPLMNVGHEGGQFIFQVKGAKEKHLDLEKTKSEEISQQDQKENEYWKSVLRKGSIQEYQNYLGTYPDGGYVQEATIIIGLLEKKNKPETTFNTEFIEKLVISLCKNQEDFEEYLNLFPNAIFKERAKKELEKLSEYINRDIIKDCRLKFSEGKTEEAIKVLLKKNFEQYDEALLYSNRLLTLLNKESKNTISRENFDLEFSKIGLGFLKLLKELENSLEEKTA